MESTTYSQFKTSRNFTYSYLHLLPTAGNEGNYLLFLHGFPSHSHDWHHQIKHFSKKGYGIICPDLLGYGATSKPSDLQAYTGKGMAKDIAGILQHENIEKVVGVAHDWGSFLLGRIANYYPSILSKLVFLDIGYTPPGVALTRDMVTKIDSSIQAGLGFSCFGYFLFFADKDAATLLDQNASSRLS
jgi:pimeloyl-ACP methyl ester carboxylesterase